MANQKINCTVHDCEYCNCEQNCCQLKDIKVCNCAPEHEKEATMCASYEKRNEK